MSDQDLLVRIKELNEQEEEPLPERVLRSDTFLYDPRNSEILGLFEKSSYKKYEWNWHQVVRFALKKANSQQYMYEKLWNLLLKHRGHYNDYFELETDEGTFPIPNPLTDLNRFETLYSEFFKIYSNIINQIHFDYPKKEYYGPNFRGKINWQKTFQKSKTSYPINFVSDIPVRKFVTPGNILLMLCVLWMHRESTRILQLSFGEPLGQKEKDILYSIAERTKNILLNFPFQDVVKESTKYWNLQNDDKLILFLESQVKKRIAQGIVRNQNYQKLLDWIQQFRNLNLMMVSEKTPVKNLLKSQQSQDTVYEAWMFMEFFDYFFERGFTPTLNLESKPYYFEFGYQGQKIIFWYERQFNPPGPYVWAVQHKPDFSVMVDDKIIGIFDAKNFSQGEQTSSARTKMLAYMSNFNTEFGVLFFPFVPEFWDEWSKKERRKALFPIYSKENPVKSEEQIQSMNMPEVRKSWNELSTTVQKHLVHNSVRLIPNPQDPGMKFYLMRMEPSNSELAIKMKNQSVEKLFEEIIKRIPITVKT